MESTKIALGVIAGAIAGVTIGLLLAPMSGKETRKNLADTAGNWGNSLKKRFESLTGMDSESDDPWAEYNRAPEDSALVSNNS